MVCVFYVPSSPNFMKVSVGNARVCMFNGMLTSETYIMEPGADHTHATINYNTYDWQLLLTWLCAAVAHSHKIMWVIFFLHSHFSPLFNRISVCRTSVFTYDKTWNKCMVQLTFYQRAIYLTSGIVSSLESNLAKESVQYRHCRQNCVTFDIDRRDWSLLLSSKLSRQNLISRNSSRLSALCWRRKQHWRSTFPKYH